jgi:putative intracellular protease/amidase
MLRRLEVGGLHRDADGFIPKQQVMSEFRGQIGATPLFISLFFVAPFSPTPSATLVNLLKGRVDFAKLGGDGFFNHRWRSGLFDRQGAFDEDAFSRMASFSTDGKTLTLREWSTGQRASLATSRAAGENIPHDLLPTMYEGIFVSFDGALLFSALGRRGADGVRRVRLDEVHAFFQSSRLPDRSGADMSRAGGLTVMMDGAVAGGVLARGALPVTSARPLWTLDTLIESVHTALNGLVVDRGLLRSALARLPAYEATDFRDGYMLRYGRDPIAERILRGGSEMKRLTAFAEGRAALSHVIGLKRAFDLGDAAEVALLLDGPSYELIEEVKSAYRAKYKRDLEYDMRGFSLDWTFFDPRARPKLWFRRRGLRGEGLNRALRLLHEPRMERCAKRIATLLAASETSTPEGRREIYAMLAVMGGEERTLLDEKVTAVTGKDLVTALRPVFSAHARENAKRPVASAPERTAAVVVSSGNWSKMLRGEHNEHVGGYHWQEFYDEAEEAYRRGWSVEFFTPEGLPPSPDQLSLLQTQLGPLFGFGLAAGTGPDSPVGLRIYQAFWAPRPLVLDDGSFVFDASRFGTFHVAGGHGSPHDVVNNPAIERAAREMHEKGKVISAVCHATSALGPLLKGGNTTGFPKLVDDVMGGLGYLLDEFRPPFHTHKDLRERVGARVSAIRATLNPAHTEVFRPGDGRADIHTGTGPIATAPMARKKYASIEAREEAQP